LCDFVNVGVKELGNARKARIKLGWKPKTSLDELLLEMVREDLKSLERDEM
jgi:GDPmannose 4,6-dehydratase